MCPNETVKCDECSRPAKVLLRIGHNRNDWCYQECENCGDNLCSKHSVPDGCGNVYCDICTQQLAIAKE